MYEVSEDKLHELNVIVGEKGGTIPTKVSDALAAMQIAYETDNEKEYKKQFRIAVEANKLNGAAWSDVQKWHDDVKESGNGGPIDPPVVITPPPAGISTPPCRYAVTAVEASQHFQLQVDVGSARVTIAVADGKQVTLGYSTMTDEYKEGQASSGNGTAMAIVPAGLWYINYKLSPGMGGAANGDVSAYMN